MSFKLDAGKTLAIVGESGCGKSTLARILTFIDPPTSGELLIDGKAVDTRPGHLTAEMRQKVQIVFQNPYGSLNPRKKIGDILTEPLVINTKVPADERRDRAMAMLKTASAISSSSRVKPVRRRRIRAPWVSARTRHRHSWGRRAVVRLLRRSVVRPAPR